MGKKKGKGAGKKGKKIVDGISTAEMSREQLLGHIRRLQNEIDREREERNFFMLEREKLFSLWSLAVEKITIEKDKARLAEVQRDDARENKEEEMNLQKQKVRFLMSEHLKQLGAARLDYLQRMKLLQDQFWKLESVLKADNQERKKELGDARLCHLQTIRNLQFQHSQNITEMRSQYSKQVRRTEVQSDLILIKHREMVDLECKQDLIQTQILKDEQLNQLIQTHSEQLTQLKDYYNELTVNNLAIIATLQEELTERRTLEEKLRGELERSQINCQHLAKRVAEQEGKMVQWTSEEKQIASRIKQVRRMDQKVERNRKQLEWMGIENEALVQKNLGATREIDFLKRCLAKIIMEMQMKAAMSQVLLYPQQKFKSKLIED